MGTAKTAPPKPDLAAQVRLAFSNLNAVLHAAGCTLDDVVDVTMFVVNLEAELRDRVGYRPEFWGEAPYPTLTGIGVSGCRLSQNSEMQGVPLRNLAGKRACTVEAVNK